MKQLMENYEETKSKVVKMNWFIGIPFLHHGLILDHTENSRSLRIMSRTLCKQLFHSFSETSCLVRGGNIRARNLLFLEYFRTRYNKGFTQCPGHDLIEKKQLNWSEKIRILAGRKSRNGHTNRIALLQNSGGVKNKHRKSGAQRKDYTYPPPEYRKLQRRGLVRD